VGFSSEAKQLREAKSEVIKPMLELGGGANCMRNLGVPYCGINQGILM
jgi:hypothetical protein